MLPTRMRARLFDQLSVKTMQYLHLPETPRDESLNAQVYAMVEEEFFINGSITSHACVPELMAGMWLSGREIVLVSDQLNRTTKEAMAATLSQLNDCPYCGDMLISLVHGGGEHEVASHIFNGEENQVTDPDLREQLQWIKAVGTGALDSPPVPPFSKAQLPEAIGTLLQFNYVNRFSHVVMDGSPIGTPLGWQKAKAATLRLFGAELKTTTEKTLSPGRALELLPRSKVAPSDISWAAPNARITDALCRWIAAVERQSREVVSTEVRHCVQKSLTAWHGETMPLGLSWVEAELNGLNAEDRNVARLALLVAKAPYQVDSNTVKAVLGKTGDESRLVKVLAWASMAAARHIANRSLGPVLH